MKNIRLARILGLIDDDLIEESGSPRRRIHWLRWTALAACLCVAFLGAWRLTQLRKGSAETPAFPAGAPPENAVPGDSAGTADNDMGAQEGAWLCYDGPVLPLTLSAQGITAERDVAFSLEGESAGSALVTDSYVLTNTTGEDITCTAYYPFAGSLYSFDEAAPDVAVDGEIMQTRTIVGEYAGTYDDDGMNLYHGSGWEAYASLLSDGEYLEQAMQALPPYEENVVVYRVYNGETPEDESAATVCISFIFDEEKTDVLSFDMNGLSYNKESGRAEYSYFTREWQKNCAYIVVIGDDIMEYSVQGYKNGSCTPGQELDIECSVSREEMTMGDFLRLAVSEKRATYETMYGHDANVSIPDEELFYRAVCTLWDSFGPTADGAVPRYMEGRIDALMDDAYVMQRVCYMAFEITIPAGGSVTVSAQQTRSGAHNFNMKDSAAGFGYDLLITTGSSISFARATVSVELGSGMLITADSMGLAGENGVLEAELAPTEEHYYLTVEMQNGDSGN